jgi:thiol-disulfide isomerase/thioredoxin
MARWSQHLLLIGLSLSLSLAACSGDSPGADDDSMMPPPGTADAAVQNAVDAGPTGDPDSGTPVGQMYPPGPYGITVGSVISNRTWKGYADTAADPDIDPFNEPAHAISLADYYTPNSPTSRLVVLMQSAGWCGPCQEEAATLPSISATWQPKGVHFITLMWQDPNGSPGSTDYAKTWGAMFHLDTPVVADPDDFGGQEPFGNEGIPFLVLIDTKTMKIVDFPYGVDNSGTYEMYTH